MIRELMKCIREFKRPSILSPVLVSLEVVMECLIPLVIANLVNEIKAGCGLDVIGRYGLLLVVMAGLSLAFGAKAGQVAAVAAAGYAKNLRHDIFYKIQEFSFGNIDHFSTSSLVTRLTTDITNVQMAFMFSIRMLARAPIMVVLSWIMTATISLKIAFLMLVTIPILGGVLIFIAKKAHPHFIAVFDEYDVLNNTVQENVNAARVVKAYVREEHENGKFHKISQKVFELFTKAEMLVSWNAPVMNFVMYTVVLLIVLLGGEDIVLGTMMTGELTSIMVYTHVPDDGILRFCYDHDRRSVFRQDQRGAGGGAGDGGQGGCPYRCGKRGH